VSFYTVKVLLTTWTAISPTQYPKFESALEKALSCNGHEQVTVWEYAGQGDKTVGRMVWHNEFGGINEFSKYGRLSERFEKLLKHFSDSVKRNHYPNHAELAQVSGIQQHRIYSALSKLAWAGYLHKDGKIYRLVSNV
jgi:hypothetical protein